MIQRNELTVSSGTAADFGKDAFAWLEVFLEPGERAEASVGECLKNGRIDREPGGYRCFKSAVVSGTGTEGAWIRMPFPAHKSPYKNATCQVPEEAGGEITPFRYAEVTGLSHPVRIRRSALFPEWDEDASRFECDNALLNQVWDFCRYSVKATAAFGYYIDGERERCPYEGDSFLNQLSHFCCNADYSIAQRTIEFFHDHFTWPTEWQLLTPILARDYLLYSGDRASVDRWLEWLPERLLDQYCTVEGLVQGRKDIVDWPECERDGYEFSDINLVPNCVRYAALKAMYDLTEDSRYETQASALKQTLRKVFFRDGAWRDNPVSDHVSLHGPMFARYCGVTDPSEDDAINRFLVSRGMACSVYGAQYLLDTLSELGNAEQVIRLMTDTGSRSWLGMISAGSTITMEAWNSEVKPNQDWNHAWGSAPANIIPRRICGIRPVQPGFRRFLLDPQPGPLRRLLVKHPSPCGSIELELEGSCGTLTVPDGTEALFRGTVLTSGKHDIRL